MTLGIIVRSAESAPHLRGIVEAAEALGHDVNVFVMDEGVKLLASGELEWIRGIESAAIAYCDYNAMLHDIPVSKVTDVCKAGSQFNNLMMVRASDRVITL